MKIDLKLRALTAYCSPSKAILADNEEITITILDRGQLKNRVVLLCNGKSYVADGKTVAIPRSELTAINVLELTERDEADKVLKRFAVENLYVLPCGAEYEGNRLLAEREFYKNVFTPLLSQVAKLTDRQAELEKRVADLENGKFTMFKFGGEQK